MSQQKYTDGKVLRAAGTVMFLPDLMVMLRGLEGMPGHMLDDLRVLDDVAAKINSTLEGQPFYVKYTDALNAVAVEIATKHIGNDVAIAFLHEQALGPIMLAHAQEQAPDVFLSVQDWTWLLGKWRQRTNLSGDPAIRTRTLRITDVLENALGYKNMPDRTIAIEGETEEVTPKLKAV